MLPEEARHTGLGGTCPVTRLTRSYAGLLEGSERVRMNATVERARGLKLRQEKSYSNRFAVAAAQAWRYTVPDASANSTFASALH